MPSFFFLTAGDAGSPAKILEHPAGRRTAFQKQLLQRLIVVLDRSVEWRVWAIVDSNHGPPPYQSGALTN
jgi:hypothetical protein